MITLLQKRYTMTMTEHEARELCNELGELLAGASDGVKVPRVLEVYKLLDGLGTKQGHSQRDAPNDRSPETPSTGGSD